MNTEKYIKYYRILSRAYFHLPLLVLFFSNLGYKFKEIIFLILVYSLTSFIFLIFKNKITNFTNLKKKVYASELFKIIGLLCFIFLNNNIIFLIIGQILLSLSYSLQIGVDTLMINQKYQGKIRMHVQASTNSYMFLSLLISAIIGGIVYSINIVFPFILSLLGALLIIWITIRNRDQYSVKIEAKKESSDLSKNYLPIIYYGLSRGIVLTLFIAVIPFLLLEKNISPIIFVLILSMYTLAGFVSSKYYLKINKTYLFKVTISLLLILFGIIFIALNSLISIAIGLIFFGIGVGLVRPLAMEKIRSPSHFNTMETMYFIVNIIILVIILLKK